MKSSKKGTMKKEINVNELNTLLDSDEIIEVWVASGRNQHNPVKMKVGIAGQLTIIYDDGKGDDVLEG